MPLVTCPDCQKDVSDRAPTCPHCGAPRGPSLSDPIRNPMPKTEGIFMQSLNIGCLITLGFVGLFVLFIFIAMISGGSRR